MTFSYNPSVRQEAEMQVVCPVCGCTRTTEIRSKLHCFVCHAILETCCEGAPPCIGTEIYDDCGTRPGGLRNDVMDHLDRTDP
jgi:hypothetical protein